MQVVVTRPQREAKAWIQALHDAGHEVLALPLIAFESLPSPMLPPLETYRALMFVSAQAVAAYFDEKEHSSHENQAQAAHFFEKIKKIHPSNDLVRCWAPGPGTARALRQAGVPADRIDQPDPHGAQFDSEALWQVVRGQVGLGDRILIVRGESEGQPSAAVSQGQRQGHGRDWLAQQCEAAGATVDYAVVYRRVCPLWRDDQRVQATQAVKQALWLFSNVEALGHLTRLLPHADWHKTPAVVTHARVAQAAHALGFAPITICRPDVADVLFAVARELHVRTNGS